MSTLDRVRAIIAEELAVGLERVTENVTLDELGADSLDRVSLGMKLEEQFGLKDADLPSAAGLDTAAKIAAAIEAIMPELRSSEHITDAFRYMMSAMNTTPEERARRVPNVLDGAKGLDEPMNARLLESMKPHRKPVFDDFVAVPVELFDSLLRLFEPAKVATDQYPTYAEMQQLHHKLKELRPLPPMETF